MKTEEIIQKLFAEPKTKAEKIENLKKCDKAMYYFTFCSIIFLAIVGFYYDITTGSGLIEFFNMIVVVASAFIFYMYTSKINLEYFENLEN